MNTIKQHIILCNNAPLPKDVQEDVDVLNLDYRSKESNLSIKLPNFVNSLYHLPDNIKDLLEIASYIFAADRNIKRGEKSDVEYQKWSRHFHFIIKVRDYQFWSKPNLAEKLKEALKFVSGDFDFDFTFEEGHQTTPEGLFDDERFSVEPTENTKVILFSGGLDSLAGAVELLETTNDNLCLISHRSGQPGTKKTQDKLVSALQRDYSNRCKHYSFSCNLKGVRAVEETQRTRSFLYCSIAFSLSHAIGLDRFFVFENGITSLNFARRQDLINARASRTTHPKTLALFAEFFSLFCSKPFLIEHPYLFCTKTDVLSKIKFFGKANYIDSAVSCSKTFKKDWQPDVEEHISMAPQCGGCSQCIDRRFAAFASETEEFDARHLYKIDFIRYSVESDIKTTLMDYIRQAMKYSKQNVDEFYYGDAMEFLVDIDDYIEGADEEDRVTMIHDLFLRHGKQIENALKRMEMPFEKVVAGSLQSIITNREYLKEDVEILANKIGKDLLKALPMMFHNGNLPKDEKDLNNKINALIEKNRKDYEREHPSVKFGLATIIPDHAFEGLLIETKYLRNGTTPSKASDGLAADLFKLPSESFKLLLVYDPTRSISDDEVFSNGFESKSNKCKVYIIR